MTYTENILSVYRRATAADIDAGIAWYGEANGLARQIARGDVWRGAGVIAAFSPICPWKRNKQLAIDAFATGKASGHTTVFNTMAQRILDGEHPLDVFRGDKQRAFASAIALNGHSDIATIDRHAHDIAMGKVFPNDRNIGKRLYRDIAAAYSDAAHNVDIPVAMLQAITWVSWRRRKGIRHAG